MKKFVLNNQVEMPAISFGSFQIKAKDTKQAVLNALSAGFRAIDTAYTYQNEQEIGQAIATVNIPREQLFITSKAYIQQMGYENTKKAIDDSLTKLNLDYLDLYLIHMPFGDYYGSWQAMIEAQKAGKIRAIGVSNFDSSRLIDLVNNFDVKPVINQIEHHPHYQRDDEIKVMRELDILPEAWAPFAEGLGNMFKEPVLKLIAEKHQQSVAQVILRWNYQLGIPTIAKSLNEEHLKQNLNIFDFALDDDDLQAIAKLDTGKPAMLDINKPSEVRRVYDYLKHPVLTSL